MEVAKINQKGWAEIERIVDDRTKELLATIIPRDFRVPGISFVTEDDSVHQLGVLNWPRGHQIGAHVHNTMSRHIDSTQEVLFIRSGRVRVDLYGNDRAYQCSRFLGSGDVIFLSSGGHGFEIIEDSDMVEIKQGPYLGDGEKTRFSPDDNPYAQ